MKALAFIAALLFASAAHALPEQTWLVAIGNNTGDAGDVALRYAESDARTFAAALQQLGGVSADRVRLILDSDAATARRTLDDVRAAIAAAEGSTALVVYYSGHADATALHMAGSHLSFDTLRRLVQDNPASLRLLVVDACRSGGVSRVKGGGAVETFAVTAPGEAVPEGFAVLTSSAAGESSQESDHLGASFFSHHLVAGIRGAADRDDDRRVTLSEAYDYAYSQTVRSSGRTLQRQHPTYAFGFKGKGGLVLAELDRHDRRAGTLRLREASVYVVRDRHAAGPLVAEVAPERDGAALYLPAGRYFVQQRLPRAFREFEVEVEADAEADLGAAPFATIDYDRLVRARGSAQRSAHGFLLLGGVRGEVVPGEGPAPHLALGYRLDVPWFSVGLRARGSTVGTVADGGRANRTRDELGLALTLERFVDLSWATVGVGLLAEAALGRQTFDSERQTPERRFVKGGFGGVLAVEHHVGAGFGLRLEGGPLTVVGREAIIEEGAEVGSELGARFVGWAALGLTWRL